MPIGDAPAATPRKSHRILYRILEKAGIFLVVAGLIILFFTFAPVLKEELKYRRNAKLPITVSVMTREEAGSASQPKDQVMIPENEEFGIVIPKIEANAVVIPEVDWQDSRAYQRALTRGVAHAMGTSVPGEGGNIFIFAHSGVDFYEAARYNAVFYLMNKLEPGDIVYLFYQGKKYGYEVREKKLVAADAVEYLERKTPEETLTLMTCWPPGTTMKRLIVRATALTPSSS